MTQPTITIGMVVRNGERWVAAAIESFLGQAFPAFVLDVHDNASTDRTPQIVAAIMRRDARVRLHRKERNVGVVRNLIAAAAHASTPLFCWAACDDLREPEFLSTLAGLLEANPTVGLACCAVRNLDPDGTWRDMRRETASLTDAAHFDPRVRLTAYLREMPGTPFYGLFRTNVVKHALPVLQRMDAADASPLLGLDMAFLAAVVRHHGVAFTPEPLLLFRRGGISHDFGRYGSLRGYVRQIRGFMNALRDNTRLPGAKLIDRMRLSAARRRAVCRWLLSPEMRRMTAHYCRQAVPCGNGVCRHVAATFDPVLRRLRRRAAHLPANARIVLLGAGKHTQRRIDDLRCAIGTHASIIAACDDDARRCAAIPHLPVIETARLPDLRPDVLLVSSDSYEEALMLRARGIAGETCRVWCLYDLTLESGCSHEGTRESTEAMKSDNAASMSSPPAGA